MSSKQSADDNTGNNTMVGSGRKMYKLPSRRVVFGVLGIVLLLGAAIYGYYRWSVPSRVHESNSEQYNDVRASAEQLRKTGQYDQAADELEKLAATTSDSSIKLNALTEAATLYESKGDYQQALTKYKAIESLDKGKSNVELLGIARCARALKDYDTAVAYYQKAAAALDTSSPVYASDKAGIEQQINETKSQKAAS